MMQFIHSNSVEHIVNTHVGMSLYLLLYKDHNRIPDSNVFGAVSCQDLGNEAFILSLPPHGGLVCLYIRYLISRSHSIPFLLLPCCNVS